MREDDQFLRHLQFSAALADASVSREPVPDMNIMMMEIMEIAPGLEIAATPHPQLKPAEGKRNGVAKRYPTEPTKNNEETKKQKMAGKPVSRILFAALAVKPERRSDHSSRSRFAPGLQQPTRGS